MRNLFDPESPVMQALSSVGSLVLLNVLFLLCCIPIVTIGAAKSALFYACGKLREGEGHLGKTFWRGFKGNLRCATPVWLIMLLVLVLVVLDLFLVFGHNTLYTVLCFAALFMWCLFDAAVFPLCARFETGFRQRIKSGLYVAVSLLPRMALQALLYSLPTLVLLSFPNLFFRLLPLFVLLYYAAVASLANVLLKAPFASYEDA